MLIFFENALPLVGLWRQVCSWSFQTLNGTFLVKFQSCKPTKYWFSSGPPRAREARERSLKAKKIWFWSIHPNNLVVTWPYASPSAPQGNQYWISHFLACLGACNLIFHIHVVVNWQLSKQGIRFKIVRLKKGESKLKMYKTYYGQFWSWVLLVCFYLQLYLDVWLLFRTCLILELVSNKNKHRTLCKQWMPKDFNQQALVYI